MVYVADITANNNPRAKLYLNPKLDLIGPAKELPRKNPIWLRPFIKANRTTEDSSDFLFDTSAIMQYVPR